MWDEKTDFENLEDDVSSLRRRVAELEGVVKSLEAEAIKDFRFSYRIHSRLAYLVGLLTIGIFCATYLITESWPITIWFAGAGMMLWVGYLSDPRKTEVFKGN